MFLVFETEGSEAFGYNLVFVVNLFHDFWLAFERCLSGVPKKKKNPVTENSALVVKMCGRAEVSFSNFRL